MAFCVLCVALVASSISSAAPSYKSYPQLDEISSWLAMRPTSIHCLTKKEAKSDYNIVERGADAYVDGTYDSKGRWHPGDFAVFNYGLCEQLVKPTSVPFFSWAVLVITHESGHLRDATWSESEAKTQCWAIRHVRFVVARMGYDSGIQNLVLSFALKYHKAMSPVYLLDSCRLPKVNPIVLSPFPWIQI